MKNKTEKFIENKKEEYKKSKGVYTPNPDDVIRKEREALGLKDGERVCGLSVSGGGIRSASFGLGVMQALVANNQLEKFHYLSTVSGGGYLGSALTWALHQGKGAYGVTPDNFPLGEKGSFAREENMLEQQPAKATKTDAGTDAEKAARQGNKLLDFIRQHSSYLTPTPSLDMISFVAVALRSMLIALFVYFSFMVIAATVSARLHLFDALWLQSLPKGIGYHFPFRGIFFPTGIFLLLIYVLMSGVYSVMTFFSTHKNQAIGYSAFVFGQELIGVLWKIAFSLMLVGTLPYFFGFVNGAVTAAEAATGSTLTGMIVGAWQYMKAQKNEESSGLLSGIAVYIGAFALLYGLLLGAYVVAHTVFTNPETHGVQHIRMFFALVVLAIALAVYVNLNLAGPHRIWRNRLMEAFMPNKNAVEFNQWEKATEADDAMMADMCWEKTGKERNVRRPYHIVNTNIILANAREVKYKGRGGDSFIISPLFCGSDATGWKETRQYQKTGDHGLSLATAMATSAAALNPNAAVSGEGATRSIVVSVLLSFLNLRLGYWANNPFKDNTMLPPNFLFPGLSTEIFRSGFQEDSRRIQLSDGGHFENLAMYELIRRKAALILVSDGGADPAFNFDDLANAVEKVRVDFGAKIKFREHAGLDKILPQTQTTGNNSEFIKKYAIAEHGFAIADIYYNDGTSGILVYVKLAMINGLSTDVYSYKGINPEFPHQSTADQFFDEKQFEAYRELGYYVCWQMMESPETVFKEENMNADARSKFVMTPDIRKQMREEGKFIFPAPDPVTRS